MVSYILTHKRFSKIVIFILWRIFSDDKIVGVYHSDSESMIIN